MLAERGILGKGSSTMTEGRQIECNPNHGVAKLALLEASSPSQRPPSFTPCVWVRASIFVLHQALPAAKQIFMLHRALPPTMFQSTSIVVLASM